MQLNEKIDQQGKVIFNNLPKISAHAVHEKRNKKWEELISMVENFILSHPRFKGKEVKVTHLNSSSYIVKIETEAEKFVLKVLNLPFQQGEPYVLKKWEDADVKVPHVLETGMIGEHPYFLMANIEAPTVYEAYGQAQMADQGIYTEMGRTLRAMHAPKAKGWGSLAGDKGEYASFSQYIHGEDVEKKVSYVRENNLLNIEHGSLDAAENIIKDFVNDKESSYCHMDFGATNVFATHPITVFDPNPFVGNGYMDLGRSLVLHIAKGIYPEQLIDGYSEGEAPNRRVIFAFTLLNAYLKFHYWHKIKKFEQIKNVQEYLKANRHFLE